MPKSLAQLTRALRRAVARQDRLAARYAQVARQVLRVRGQLGVQSQTVQRLEAALAAREGQPDAQPEARRPGRRGKARAWTPETIAGAVAAWQAAHGRAPRRADYDRDPSLPHSTTVLRVRKAQQAQGERTT